MDYSSDYKKIKSRRIIITFFLLFFSLALTIYFRFALNVGIVFTHFFYIPVIIVSIWWGYWGILAAVGLGVLLLASRAFTGSQNFTEDLFRSFFLITVAYLVGFISDSEKTADCRLLESEKISKMRESIISLLAHQLLNPLSSIRWAVELIFAEGVSNFTLKQKESLEGISGSIKNLIALVRDFIGLNRIEGGQIKTLAVTTNMAELIKKIIEEKEKITEGGGQTVILASSGIAEARIDPVALAQIIENLFSNAIKYTPAGGKIEISINISEKELLFKIKDTGFGIPEKEQNGVFEKFFRGSNAIKEASEGTGLGLATVKSLIDFYGGKIWFESEEKKGTTFSFVLPVGTEADGNH